MAEMFEVHASLIYAWKQLLRKNLIAVFEDGNGEEARKTAAELKEVERRIEELHAEQEWMSQAIAGSIKLRERRKLIEAREKGMSVLRQCSLLQLHRSGIYYQQEKTAREQKDTSEANLSEHDETDFIEPSEE